MIIDYKREKDPIYDNKYINNYSGNNINNNLIFFVQKLNTQLYPSFLELIKNLWDQNGSKAFFPKNFMNKVEKMNPLFIKVKLEILKIFYYFYFRAII